MTSFLKFISLISLSIFSCLRLVSQDIAIGQWETHQSYNSATHISETENKLYGVSSESLFYINKYDQSMRKLSKNTGLSDFGISKTAYCRQTGIILVVYENCNIDVVTPKETININDIKRTELIGEKTINNIFINNKIAYLSCSFGLVLIDIEKLEIKDTYNLIINEEFSPITGCTSINDSLYVSTPSGIYRANINSNLLNDFSNWSIYDTSKNNLENIVSSSYKILCDSSEKIISVSSNSNFFTTTIKDSIFVYDANLDLVEIITNSLFTDLEYSLVDSDQNIWIADKNNGLMKFIGNNYIESYIPDGPVSNQVFSLECFDSELYMCHGGHTNFGNWNNKKGASIKNSNGFWNNYNYYDLDNAKDIVSAAKHNNNIYFSSFYNGVAQITDGDFSVRWNASNTNYGIDTIGDWANDKRLSVCGLKLDNYGNLWGLTSSVQNPLFVKTVNDNWRSFYVQQQIKYLYTDLVIDSYDQKWCVIGRDGGANEIGILVYNNNNTLEDISDDEYKVLTTAVGNGNLPSLNVISIAEDLDGEIWVGTDKGITVFYNPANIFSEYNFDAEQILIQEGDYGQYLLSEEKITQILIDGANRKWVGTERSGLYLLSADGLDQIEHFTAENSPLFSNNITALTINNKTGEVYIGTSKGLLSYRSSATKGVVNAKTVKVFPNPVKENYFGLIAIDGLSTNANFKITDINGDLVYESFAQGGQAIWDGKNKSGERVGSGVYILFSSDETGKEKVEGKIVFIK